jgi:hypothetical protein
VPVSVTAFDAVLPVQIRAGNQRAKTCHRMRLPVVVPAGGVSPVMIDGILRRFDHPTLIAYLVLSYV